LKIISKPVPKEEILKEHNHFFGSMIKAVVDLKKEIIDDMHQSLKGGLSD